MANPAMKQPPTFSTGEPSYFVAARTSGYAPPRALTTSNASCQVEDLSLVFIEVETDASTVRARLNDA
jgi:hypothetical protein